MKVSYNRATEKDLWDDFLSGDFDAFDQIYNDYMPELYNYAKKFTRNEALIEDIIQDFFVDLWRKRDRLSRTDNITLYLLKSIRRRILRILEQEKKKQQINNDYVDNFIISIEPILQTDNSNRIEIKLNKALDQLSNLQKEIILLRFYNNCSLEQIGHILNLPRKSIYNGLFNAMKSLRVKIGKEE